VKEDPKFWNHLIPELRREKGMSQRRLAAIAKVSRSTLRRIEEGRTRNMSAIERLAAAMGYVLRPYDEQDGSACSPGSELGFLSEDQARSRLERLRWPNGPVCPHCTVVNKATRFKAGCASRPGVWKCKACRRQFTVTVGTPLERSRIPLRLLMMALDADASENSISPVQLQRQLGLASYQRAWRIAHRFRSLVEFVLSCPDPIDSHRELRPSIMLEISVVMTECAVALLGRRRAPAKIRLTVPGRSSRSDPSG
jgi:transposase-like protein/DNA-binding XRE family transcriptional regulator